MAFAKRLAVTSFADDGRTLTYGPATEAPLEEELAASPPPRQQQRRSLDSCLPGGNGFRAPQQAQRAASTRLREQAQQAETVCARFRPVRGVV